MKYKISFQNLKIGELNQVIYYKSRSTGQIASGAKQELPPHTGTSLVWSAMRQLYADMYRSTSTIVECTTFYLMPRDLHLFLEFHRSECQLDLQRVYIFQGHSTAAAGFFKKLVLIFSTSLVPLSGWLHPTREAAACMSPRPPRARLPPSDAVELGRHASNHSIL